MTLTVKRVDARALDIPMKKAFGIAGGAQEVARNVLVRVELAGGDGACVVGWGEAAPLPAFNGETQASVLAALADPSPFLGADATDWRVAAERASTLPSAAARCALETGILDGWCRANGTTMLQVFGGRESTLVTDVTITTGTVRDAEREARDFAAFRTLKIKVGGGEDHDVDLDIGRVLAIRSVRPEAKLLLDANGGLSVKDAIRLAKSVAHVGISLFEQPTRTLEGVVEVRRTTGLPIALDESVASAADVDEAARLGAADAVNVKLMKSGILGGLAVHAATLRHGLRPMIGGMVEGRMAIGTSACFAAGLGGFAFVDLDTPLFLAEDPFVGGYQSYGERLDLAPIDRGHGCTPEP